MFELWVPITIAAAFLQNLRSALQRHLKGRLTTTGATFVRFGFGFPVALVYLLALHWVGGFSFPAPGWAFFLYAVIGGPAQIGATFLLVHLFGMRNFAVGTAYSKTETVQAAIFGVVLLGDHLSTGAAVAIVISLVGVVLISLARSSLAWRTILGALVSPTARIGLASGALFGISAVAYRAASTSLGGPHFLMQAGYTLAWVTLLQTIAMAIWIRWREPGQLTRVWEAKWTGALVGLAGAMASAGWFSAMTIQNVAYVRALGQVELVFTFIVSVLFFHERSSRTEVTGILLIVAGILLLLLKG